MWELSESWVWCIPFWSSWSWIQQFWIILVQAPISLFLEKVVKAVVVDQLFSTVKEAVYLDLFSVRTQTWVWETVIGWHVLGPGWSWCTSPSPVRFLGSLWYYWPWYLTVSPIKMEGTVFQLLSVISGKGSPDGPFLARSLRGHFSLPGSLFLFFKLGRYYLTLWVYSSTVNVLVKPNFKLPS